MIRSNFHTHTRYCDGKDSVFDVAAAAAEQGLTALGFSGHSTTPFDLRYCMGEADVPRYAADVARVREEYKGRLEVYLGVEDDFCGERPGFARDYTIGSVHYLLSGGVYYPVDESEAEFRRSIREGFGGDPLAMTRRYFETVAQVQDKTCCDFVGHFDLVAKYNNGLFDEEDPRYLGPALEALEYLCSRGAVLEVNTGAMARGVRSVPYPTRTLLRAAHGFGASIVLSSDCHDKRKLLYGLDGAAELAKDCGFQTARVLAAGEWREEPL